MGVTSAELSKMMKLGLVEASNLDKALESLTDKGGKFYDVLNQKSNTTEGLQNRVLNQLKQTGSNLATPAIQEYNKFLRRTVRYYKSIQ